MIGVLVNVITVLIGSSIGLLFKKGVIIRKVPQEIAIEELKKEIDKF